MSSKVITITGVTGGVPPLSFYLCDENAENCTFLGNTQGTYTASTFYSTVTSFIIKVIDSNGCFVFKSISCPLDTFFILTEDGFILSTEDGDGLIFI